MSFVVDFADHTKFSLPRFTTNAKDERVHNLTVQIIVVSICAAISHLRLLKMTDDSSTGANNVIEAIYCVVNVESKCMPLSKTLFLQVKNCLCENENKVRNFLHKIPRAVRSVLKDGCCLPIHRKHTLRH